MIQPTFARKRIDITWRTLFAFAWRYFTRPETASETESDIEKLWCPDQTLVAFTVRSGFDLCLQAYDFSPGSEIIVSAVTIPDMIFKTTAMSWRPILKLSSQQTKGVLITHLFGSRMEIDGIAAAAKRKGLVVFEDCAEAFCGRQFTGCDQANVSMFSFGLIKTATAFGGGILTIRDASILATVKSLQAKYPKQASTKYWTQLAKYSLFKALMDSPCAYGIFLGALRLLNISHHAFIRKLSRSRPYHFVAANSTATINSATPTAKIPHLYI